MGRNTELERLEIVNLPKGTKRKLKKKAGKKSVNNYVGNILTNEANKK